jgi:hypothetical protein
VDQVSTTGAVPDECRLRKIEVLEELRYVVGPGVDVVPFSRLI